MRILLINPPSPFLIDQTAFPPLGLLYLAAAVKHKHQVEVVDLAAGDSLPGKHFDLVGIGALTPHMPQIQYLIKQVRDTYGNDVRIILGGPHFTNRPGDALKLLRFGLDSACVGDGERVLLKVADSKAVFMKDSLIELDEWPRPDRTALDLSRYHYTIGGKKATSIITARGCPYACAYCSRGIGYDSIRYYHLDRVREELEDIVSMGFAAVQVYDDEMNIMNSRFYNLCSLIAAFGLKWRGFIRSDRFSYGQAEAAASTGCVELCCGVESGSEDILSRMDKRSTVQQATLARKICKDFGIKFKAFLMVGLPGETEETAAMTKDWLLTVRPDDFDIAVYTPYPGSLVADNPKKYDIVIDRDYWSMEYAHKGIPGKYKSACHTRKLSGERIVEIRDDIEAQGRKELGLGGLI